MNISSKTNNNAVKLNHIFFPKHDFPPHFLEKLLDILELSLQHLIDLIKLYNCQYEYLFIANTYAVKLNRIFFPKHNFLPHLLKSY